MLCIAHQKNWAKTHFHFTYMYKKHIQTVINHFICFEFVIQKRKNTTNHHVKCSTHKWKSKSKKKMWFNSNKIFFKNQTKSDGHRVYNKNWLTIIKSINKIFNISEYYTKPAQNKEQKCYSCKSLFVNKICFIIDF